jgi:hypothetical protein
VGTPFTGYGLEFKRNYNIEKTNRKMKIIELGQVDDQHVQDAKGDGTLSRDIEAHDILEHKARLVPTPGISPAPLDPTVIWRAFRGGKLAC